MHLLESAKSCSLGGLRGSRVGYGRQPTSPISSKRHGWCKIGGMARLPTRPGLYEGLWGFGKIAFCLLSGTPRWLNARACGEHDRQPVCWQHPLSTNAMAKFDENGPDAGADSDPVPGSRLLARENVKWISDSEFALQTMAGSIGDSHPSLGQTT